MQNGKLKVGLLVDGMGLDAWAYRMIELLLQSDYAEISLVAQDIGGSRERFDAGEGGSRHAGKALSGRIGLAVQGLLVGKPGILPNALHSVDATRLLAGVPSIEVGLGCDGGLRSIENADLAKIRDRRVDVLIQLVPGTLPGSMATSARYGVWSCGIGERGSRPDPRSGCQEVMESRPVTASTLSILAEGLDGAAVAYRSFSATDPMSLPDNRSNVLWKSLHFIPRKLKELRRIGAESFFSGLREQNAWPEPGDLRFDGSRHVTAAGVLLWKKALQKARRKWNDRLYFRQWFLLYAMGDGIATSLCKFKPLMPPKDRFWADPFVVVRDGKYYLYIEECPYDTRKGHISMIVLNADGSFEPPVRILETPYHLSYPFIFEFEGSLYMIPESGANRTVDLYKCTAFPLKWEFQKHIRKDVQAVDTTLFEWQGKWWMFANEVETRGASTWDELFVYFSDSPLSDRWISHPKNPVVSDVRSARPAGCAFIRNGRLYRPSQNCSGHYGYGFNICEIKTLTETEYEEWVVERVEPKWDRNVVSTHTFNHQAGLTIIDGQLRRRR